MIKASIKSKSLIVVMIAIMAMVFSFSAVETGALTRPAKVEKVKITAVGYNDISIFWAKTKKVTGYKIYLSSKKDSGFKLYKTLKASTNKIKVKGLRDNHKYYVKVKAYKKVKVKKHTKYYYSKKALVLGATTKRIPSNIGGTRPANHFELLDKLYKGENITISELSLNMALGMLINGASGDTLDQLENYYGISRDEVNSFAKKTIEYYNTRKAVKTLIANSIWTNKNSFLIDKEFKETTGKNYEAMVKALNFNDESAANTINRWCSEKTNKLIPSIVGPADIRDAELAILNALYFKGNWETPYSEKDEVQDQEFTNADGSKKTISMLKSKEDIYLENDYATGVMKPYNDNIYFVGILPKAEGDFDMANLDIESLIKNPSYKYDVRLKMPEFTVKTTADLGAPLKAMGVTDIFSEENAKLNGMGSAIGKDNLFVSLIKQKAVVKLDKKGTEAAAVTAIIIKATSAGPTTPPAIKEITLNRPYAFLIYDKKNDVILFEGKIVNK